MESWDVRTKTDCYMRSPENGTSIWDWFAGVSSGFILKKIFFLKKEDRPKNDLSLLYFCFSSINFTSPSSI